MNFINELKRNEQIDSLKKSIDLVTISISKENARLESVKERQSVLNANRTIGGTSGNVTISQLKQAMDFHQSEILKIKEEEIQINRSIGLKKWSWQK